jgi:hypothetical protein
MVSDTKNPAYQAHMVEPCASLAFPKQVANATSNKPAMINNIQFIRVIIKMAQS